MDRFSVEFVSELFLDSDSVNSLNRLVVAIANIVSENSENVSMVYEYHRKNVEEEVESVRQEQFAPQRFFFERIVQSYSDKEYLERFKMRRNTVENASCFLLRIRKITIKSYLWNKYKCFMVSENMSHKGLSSTTVLVKNLEEFGVLLEPNPMVSLDKKMHIFIQYLVSDCAINSIAGLFHLKISTVKKIIREMAILLSELKFQYISWPSLEEQSNTRAKVHGRFRIPNCVGFIDVSRIKLPPNKNKSIRHQTLLLQCVCDDSLMFTDVHVGEIGEIKKNRVYKSSNLYKELSNFVDYENHILGDSEFKLHINLITPFSSDEMLTSGDMIFNEIHCNARHFYIGRAFELLRDRFLRINHINSSNLQYIKPLLTAACVLHNIVLLHEGLQYFKEEIVICEDGVTIDTDFVKSAVEKRQYLSDYTTYMQQIE